MTLCKYCIIYDINYVTNQPLHHMDGWDLLTKPIPPVFKLVLTVDDTCCLSHLQSAIISPEGYAT